MIISRTPFRLSFFGGGTDYPGWYRQEGGSVLSTSINKYCYITCRHLPPFFGIRHRIVWSHIEHVNTFSEILHPAVREGLRYLGFDQTLGLEIHHQGDLPARSGIGSSSSFSVGLIHALMGLRGQKISKRELALKAIEFEQQVLKESVGSQDQAAAAWGGFNQFIFHRHGEIERRPVDLPAERIRQLESRLLLIYLGSSRMGGELASSVVANLQDKAAHLRRMREMVDIALGILRDGGSLDRFGVLLHEAWTLKQSLAEGISTEPVQAAYEKARAAGALGGKLMGAGGTGFMFFYVPPERRDAVSAALNQYLHVPFAFDHEGSTIIHYDSP